MTHMELDSLFGQIQVAGDFFIRVPLYEQVKYILFTRGQVFGRRWSADDIQEIGGSLGGKMHLPSGGRFDSGAEFRHTSTRI